MKLSTHRLSFNILIRKNYKISNGPKQEAFEAFRSGIAKNFYTDAKLCEKVSYNLTDIGEGIREVAIKEWYVKEGDKVSQFDNICEVQSDKASVTITSRYDGVISRLYYGVDDTAYVGQPLVDIETDQESETTTEKNKKESSSPEQETLVSAKQNESEVEVMQKNNCQINETILCIPSVRRLAKEYEIDLTKVKATGKNGRLLKEDVLKYLEDPSEMSSAKKCKSSTSDAQNSRSNIRFEIAGQKPKLNPKTEVPLKLFQKAMLRTMTESLKIPHFVLCDELKITKISELLRKFKSENSLGDIKLNFLPFFIKAVSNSLFKYPILNSSLGDDSENIIYHNAHNIGVAMDTGAGLAVPVIRHVQDLTVIEIAEELSKAKKSGKTGNFSSHDLTGATFTVSNIGAIGGTYSQAVIVSPQVAIVAIGKSQVLPKFNANNEIVAEEIVNISASGDHRIIDGATMANFINFIKKQLEQPYLLLLNL